MTSKKQGFLRPPVLETSHPKQWRSLSKKEIRLPMQSAHTRCLHCHYWGALKQFSSPTWLLWAAFESGLHCWQCQFQTSEARGPKDKQVYLPVACAAVVHIVHRYFHLERAYILTTCDVLWNKCSLNCGFYKKKNHISQARYNPGKLLVGNGKEPGFYF